MDASDDRADVLRGVTISVFGFTSSPPWDTVWAEVRLAVLRVAGDCRLLAVPGMGDSVLLGRRTDEPVLRGDSVLGSSNEETLAVLNGDFLFLVREGRLAVLRGDSSLAVRDWPLLILLPEDSVVAPLAEL